MRWLYDWNDARRYPARTLVTSIALTSATTVVFWRLLFHQALWLVGLVAVVCSLVVVMVIVGNLRRPEAAANRAFRRVPWVEVTFMLAALAAVVVAILVGEPGLALVALVLGFLGLMLHRVRTVLRRRLSRG
jgi:small-conductance mechanosensitive channel